MGRPAQKGYRAGFLVRCDNGRAGSGARSNPRRVAIGLDHYLRPFRRHEARSGCAILFLSLGSDHRGCGRQEDAGHSESGNDDRSDEPVHCRYCHSGHCRLPVHCIPASLPPDTQHTFVRILPDRARSHGVSRNLVRISLKSSPMAQRSWTAYLVPTEHRRVNEFVGLLLLTIAILLGLSLISFNPDDPSFNISRNPLFAEKATNVIGVLGAYVADVFFQAWGSSSFLIPIFLGVYAFYWLASWPVTSLGIRLSGMILMIVTVSASLSLSSFL